MLQIVRGRRLRPLMYVPRRWFLGYAPAYRAGERGRHQWAYADRSLMYRYGGNDGETQ